MAIAVVVPSTTVILCFNSSPTGMEYILYTHTNMTIKTTQQKPYLEFVFEADDKQLKSYLKNTNSI